MSVVLPKQANLGPDHPPQLLYLALPLARLVVVELHVIYLQEDFVGRWLLQARPAHSLENTIPEEFLRTSSMERVHLKQFGERLFQVGVAFLDVLE